MIASRDDEDARILSGVTRVASAEIFERIEERLAGIRVSEKSSIIRRKIEDLDLASTGI